MEILDESLEQIARELKIDILKMFYSSKTGHLAPALSCIDILTVLYFGVKKDQDKIILSKGHGAAALYAVLAKAKVISREELSTFYKYNSKLLGLASYGVQGIDLPTGSLGQGICFATGVAKSYQIDDNKAYVYCILGDGEMQEGSVWEAVIFAANQKLKNLVVILDYNKIQASDRLENIAPMMPIREKWEAFGWNVEDVDGHDLMKIKNCIEQGKRNATGPMLIIAHTIKGKGISFIEDKNNCHTLNPKGEEWNDVCKEFNITLKELETYEK